MAQWCSTAAMAFIFCGIQVLVYGSDKKCFGDSCYTFSKSGKKWSENRDTCKGEGGDLVSMETEEEWQFINKEIQKLNIDGPHEWHIGLKKVGDDWQWVNGEQLTINKWQKRQPSGDGDFTVMSKDFPSGSQGLFNDLANYHKRAYICELPNASSENLLPEAGVLAESDKKCFGDSCYTISISGKTWSENQDSCKEKGGDLVSIETEAEWQFINSEIQKLCLGMGKPNEWHIGLKKVGDVWKWVNEKPLKIRKWQPTQPSGDGDVTVMSKDWPPPMQGLFNDLANHHKRAYICELPKAS